MSYLRKEPETVDEQSVVEPEVIPADKSSKGSELSLPGEVLPTRLHILPISQRPFLPVQALPVQMEEDRWFETIEEIGQESHHMVGLVMVESTDPNIASPDDFVDVGSVVRMHHPMREEGTIQFIAEGIERFKVVKWLTSKPPFIAQVEYPQPPQEDDKELRAYGNAIIGMIKDLLPLNPLYGEELKTHLERFSPSDPSPLADFGAILSNASGDDLLDVLRTIPLKRRMEKVLHLLKQELEVGRLQTRIRTRVEEKMTEQQRQFFLREQLKEIQKELGISKDDRTAELEKFTDRLKDLAVPEATMETIQEEMDKLNVLETGSPEYAVTRNYLDWLTAIPWGKHSKDNLNLRHARRVLNEQHEGLDDVKDRIIEFIGVGAMKGEVSGSIIVLVGPPGVGKTSVGKSIADALGREFYRFSLGGMRDEAEIKGHRRTYIGAMPGKFVQAIKDAGVANPLIMLDEIDKIGASYQGDPASALLEALDPEQNSEFLDHYVDERIDLSKVLFVCTANQLDTIPGPLLDRMEIISLSGYIAAEKLAIAKNHLWPKLLERAGVKSSQLKITDASLKHIIEGYAREAGVRGLEKHLGRIIRKAAVQILKRKKTPIRVGIRQIEDYLGKPLFRAERRMQGIGVVTGLAWTAMGGATLSLEASKVHDKQRGFKLTGQLGDVMKESAEIAYSYVASRTGPFGIPEEYFDRAFIHLHVPEGATPKDGPSAGIAMATALLSLAGNKRIRRPIAMTGELTLTGLVLPIGGVREKLIAARRTKIMEVILPEDNRRDVDELPKHIIEGMKIHYAERYEQVAEIIFGLKL
ncbi:MAG: endopeptidase La [Gammaproteobacteria bacterium]|nr:endopeptidase La [Gammaproteobacteria bacterium]